MRTYTIFLASSYELQPEREKFEVFIGRQNKRLLKKNVQLRLEIWEDMGAQLNESRKQDDYNKILNVADIVVVLFWTKMGKYTGRNLNWPISGFWIRKIDGHWFVYAKRHCFTMNLRERNLLNAYRPR